MGWLDLRLGTTRSKLKVVLCRSLGRLWLGPMDSPTFISVSVQICLWVSV